MKYTRRHTPQSQSTYLNNLTFVFNKWGLEIAENFETLTEELISKLESGIIECPPSKIDGLHKCKIHKNVSLIYRVNDEYIDLISFIDNRSDHNF